MKTCYMCGRQATSVEHVPPRCLFPEKKDLPVGMDLRKALITVPSCDEHNSRKSSDDEYLLYCLILSIPSNEVAKNHFLSKIVRAVQRNPSLLMKFTKVTQNVMVEDTRTNEWSDSIGCQIDDDRFDSALEHISRALFFHHYKKRWSGSVGVYPNFLLSMDGNAKDKNNSIRKMDDMSEALFSSEEFFGENPEVFKYCAVDKGVGEPKFMRLHFYGGNRVTVIFKAEG